MKRIRIFTDEDIYASVAVSLRTLGYDALSTPESGRYGLDDELQLSYSSDLGCAILTFNVGHFAKLHAEWMAQGREHAGIIVSQQRPQGDLLRRLAALLQTIDADTMRNRIEFLGQW